MNVCLECTEHRMVYDKVVGKEWCECPCHTEAETGCITDPCCR
ncbi:MULTISPECIES: hypothetical protein [Candidatus Nitrosocaldus]|nr:MULTISPECIES: hypothetical protein [Candidatus Nitrosocaldus]